MHCTGAAERQEGEICGIVPALDGDGADRAGHARDGDVQDALGELVDRQAEAFGDIAHRLPRAVALQVDAAAKPARRAEPSEWQIGIGDRWLRAAMAIAGGTRPRTGAERTDA
jgi:hypothetical protein